MANTGRLRAQGVIHMGLDNGRRWRSARRVQGPIRALRRFLANTLSVRLLRLAHQRSAPIRLGLGAVVGVLWLGFGAAAAIDHGRARLTDPPATTATLQTPALLLAVSEGICFMQSGKKCDFDQDARDIRLRVSQTALSLLTLLTLLFGFWTHLLGSVARALRSWGAGHVIITGEGLQPEQLARDVARRGRAHRKAVVLIRHQASDADIHALAADGVALLAGPVTDQTLLRAAGAGSADRTIALSTSSSENVAVAAAVRKVRRHSRAGDVLVRLEDPRARRDLTRRGNLRSADTFSLADVAARQLARQPALLDEIERRGAPGAHIAIIGWDETSMAIAAQMLRLMWLPGWVAPRVSVFAPDASNCERTFRARFPNAFIDTFWKADIVFHEYDWDSEVDPWAPLDACAAARGAITSVVVSWPDDDDTLRCAAVLSGEAGPATRPLLLVREGANAVVSLALDSTDTLNVMPFGAPDELLSADALVDRSLDDAARLVHDAYIETVVLYQHEDRYLAALARGSGLAERIRLRLKPPPATGKKDDLEQHFQSLFGMPAWWRLRETLVRALLERGDFKPSEDRPAQKPWDELSENYIAGNRVGADHALVKLWYLGYRPAGSSERGGLPTIGSADVSRDMSETEHRRWGAEVMLAGWRRGDRNDAALTHPDIRDYAEFPEAEVTSAIVKDRDPWLAAPRIGRRVRPRGWVRRMTSAHEAANPEATGKRK